MCYSVAMRLFEHEAKALLRDNGFLTSQPITITSLSQLDVPAPCVLKAQVLFGNRKQQGLIHVCQTQDQLSQAKEKLRQAYATLELPDDTPILVEELLPYQEEFYLALRYDTVTRLPVVMFSQSGGTGIEARADEVMQTFPLHQLANTSLPTLSAKISQDWLQKLIKFFFENDLTLLEINPLVVHGADLVSLDGKLELDDTAAFRHPNWADAFPPRTLFQRQPTQNEKKAKQVNAMDHRGVAGASYLDFEGTIGILASGGGASLLAMDALLSTQLKPANYTEYSGNPPREKVKGLADIVLSKPGLEGLWVIGGHANFTDIYETLMGVMDGVEAAKLPSGFPIIVRRGGPRMEEAFAALQDRAKNLGYHIEVFDSQFPITDTALVLEKAVEAFRSQQGGK